MLEHVVGRQLLVDAHVGLEHGVELAAGLGVEVAVDLVLEHVLGEGGEGHGHFGGTKFSASYPFNFFAYIVPRVAKSVYLGKYI